MRKIKVTDIRTEVYNEMRLFPHITEEDKISDAIDRTIKITEKEVLKQFLRFLMLDEVRSENETYSGKKQIIEDKIKQLILKLKEIK